MPDSRFLIDTDAEVSAITPCHEDNAKLEIRDSTRSVSESPIAP